MTFQDAVRRCLNKYADFRGRAARPEFWWFALLLFVANIVLSFVDGMLFGDLSLLAGLFFLATILPALAVSVRRLHDIGKSGWWVLLHLIPVIGFLVLLYFYVQPTEARRKRVRPGTRALGRTGRNHPRPGHPGRCVPTATGGRWSGVRPASRDMALGYP